MATAPVLYAMYRLRAAKKKSDAKDAKFAKCATGARRELEFGFRGRLSRRCGEVRGSGYNRLLPRRRVGRVAEGGGLLNRCRTKSSTGGSNPPLSAIPFSSSRGPIHLPGSWRFPGSSVVLETLGAWAISRCFERLTFISRFMKNFFRSVPYLGTPQVKFQVFEPDTAPGCLHVKRG